MQAHPQARKNKARRKPENKARGVARKARPRARNPNLTRLSVLKSAHQSLQKLSLKQKQKITNQ